MKQLIKNYTFSVSGKTITCNDFNSGQPLLLSRLIVIADATTNKTLWSPIDSTLSTATVTSNNVITLSALQGGENTTDALEIYYETQPGDQNYSGPLPTNFLDILPASINVTAADSSSTTTAGINGQSIITGTPTVNSAASVVLAGIDAVRVQVSGTWSGTLVSEISFDGGTTWYSTGIHLSGTNYNVGTFAGNFGGHCNVAGCTNFRIRAMAFVSGTAVVKVIESLNPASFYLANSPQIADGTTPSQKLAIDASGRITEVNAATYLPIIGIPNIDKQICNPLSLSNNTVTGWNTTGTVNGSLASSGALTITMNTQTNGVGPANLPSNGMTIKIDNEQMTVNTTSTVAGVTTFGILAGGRGANGTTPAAHSNGATLTTVIGFTPNEIEITNTSGVALVYYTLDGTTPSSSNFTGVLVQTPCATILPCNGTGPALGGGVSLQLIAAGTPLVTIAIRGA